MLYKREREKACPRIGEEMSAFVERRVREGVLFSSQEKGRRDVVSRIKRERLAHVARFGRRRFALVLVRALRFKGRLAHAFQPSPC